MGASNWLPKSQLSDPHNYDEGDRGVTVTASEWIVNEKGIETD